jgi:regulator of cell morphogenesis and NO signaling
MSTKLASTIALEDLPVGTIVARHPATARVFENYSIDYCCQGNRKLREACQEKQLELDKVTADLENCLTRDEHNNSSWLDRSLTELCDHIERQHHDYLRTELPRLTGLIEKVVNAHGVKDSRLDEVAKHFRRLRSELEPHMMKEEGILFPAIRQMESAGQAQEFPFGSVNNPILCMVDEHEAAGDELKILRELTDDYLPPHDACPTWRVLLDSLAQLELDMHQHVHKENSILFPRAQALENSFLAG